VDKIFTRVGASDNISGGESTFMVEMNETALIMNNISDRSLILLDEIGRGTSTYDGISIAWSIAEFLHENSKANPKTLFATHYHELNELANRFPRIKNFHVRTREVGQKVVFLRKLAPGGTNHSFGIHVAKMAGMPQSLVDRAYQILADLEAKHIGNPSDTAANALAIAPPVQLKIVDADSLPQQLKTEIIQLDLNTMTPMDALWKLHELKKLAEK
jgi:DNA mismatch repair protein MutS